MLLDLLKAVAGIFVLMAGWFLWMTFVRRASGCGRNQDVLEYMAHGCAGCKNQSTCLKRKAEETYHELS